MADNRHEGTWTFRPRSSMVYLGLVALFLMAWLWSAIDGGMTALARTLPWIIAVGTAAWLVWGRPKVSIDAEGVTLVNPLRTVRVRWEALINVSTQYTLALHTPRGKYSAWAAPGPGRHVAGASNAADVRAAARSGQRTGPVAIGDLPAAPSGRVAAEVRRRWSALVEADAIEAGRADEHEEDSSVAWGWISLLVASLTAGLATALL